jgi:ribosomal protein S18 acetylase RimI-like enzyme
MNAYLAKGFTAEQLAAELGNPDSAFYFAELGDQVIGYLKLNSGTAQTELKDDRAVEIERIYVLKAYHGRNVGQLLYEQAIETARQQDADYLWLGVWEENPRAIRFYQKNGFVAFGRHLFKLGDDEQTDIMMKLQLKHP